MTINYPLAGTLAANGAPLAFINDAGHSPVGFDLCVTFPNPYAFQVDFDQVFDKVGTCAASPDETYAKYGIQAGASVYLDKAVFNISAPLSMSYAGFNAISAPVLWNGQIQNELIPGGVKITHPPSPFAPQVAAIYSAQAGSVELSTQHQDGYTIVFAIDDMAGIISYAGGAFAQSLSNNIESPTFCCVGGNLVVTHADVGANAYDVKLTRFGQYTPKLLNMSPTSFTVGFENSSGATVSAMTAGIAFSYSRNAKVRRNMDGVQFELSRGRALVPVAALQNLPTGNFWLQGLMTNDCE